MHSAGLIELVSCRLDGLRMATKNRIVGVPVEIRIGHVPNTSLYLETVCDFLCRFKYDLVIPDYSIMRRR
jgi:hypothetical protein